MAVSSTNDNSLFFATGLDNSGLQRGAFDAVGIIQSLSSKISKINPFAAIGIAAIGAFTLIANEGFKMARDFESAMAEVKTIANVSERDFEKLEKRVFSLYKTLGTEPPDKLANGLYEIIGAGFEANDALEILEISSKSATAGVTTSAVAADGLTTILNAFKLGIEDADRVADIMFATVDRGKISFEELSSQISIVAPLAAASGFSFEEIGGAIATLTKQGVPASVALTQIRSAIISTNDVLGSGVSKTLSIQDAFQKMYEIAGGDQNELKDLAGRIEAVNGILGIAGDNALGAAEDFEAMKNATGGVDKAFNIITSTNANQWEIFGNRVKATTKGIGDAILGMSNGVVGVLNSVLDANEPVINVLDTHRRKLNDLTYEYNDHNTNADRRKEILEELKKINPAIVTGLNNESGEYTEINKRIQAYNELLTTRIGLEKQLTEINDLKNERDALKTTVLDNELRAQDIVKNINNQFLKGGIKLNQENAQAFSEALKKDFGSSILKIKELVKIVQVEGGSLNKSLLRFALDGFAFSAAERDLERYRKAIGETTKEIEEAEKKRNNRIVTSIEIDPEKIKQVNSLLDTIRDLKQVSEIIGVDVSLIGNDDVKKRVENLKRIEKVIGTINSITTDQYKNNKKILDEYLNSETEEIRKAAEKRKSFFELKPRKKPKEDNRTEDEKFEDDLKEKEKQFKNYNLALKNNDDELAKQLKENYKLKEEDYITYLRNLYGITQKESQKALILESLDKSGSGLNPREAVTPLKLKPLTVDLNFDIDTTSINALERQLKVLEDKKKSVRTQAERDVLQVKIDAKKKEIDIANGAVKKEKTLYENLTTSLSSLNNRQLRDYIKYWRDRLNQAKKGSKEEKEALSNIESANQQIAQNVSNTFSEISSVFGELSSLFSKFGDEDMAKLLDQLSGVAQGVGEIAKGDPLSIIKGSLQVLNSAISVEIVSDTAKFEEAIKQLEKAIERLDYVISKGVGQDKVSNRKDAINDLEELQRQAELARQAELKARKEVKFLGIKLFSKGAGSGTSAEKLEELEDKAEEARRKAQELKDQLDELYTGTTEQSIVDTIISGLKEGKRDIQDFADDMKDILQNALLQAFQIKYLEKEIEKFYDMFAAAGEDQNYSAEELAELVNFINSVITGAQDEIDAINDVLEAAGIGGLGSGTQQQGLAGAISTITEDTANVLAGTLNSIRIDIATGLEIAEQSSTYLAEIVQNTSYNRFLEDMDIKLNSIDSKL